MKKKSPRGVPDFSRQGPGGKGGARPDAAPGKGGARPAPPAPRVKPPATSSKSGQRGT